MPDRKDVRVSPPAGFHVGGWLAQPSLNVIVQAGTVRHLEPQVMDLLAFLATHDEVATMLERQIEERAESTIERLSWLY